MGVGRNKSRGMTLVEVLMVTAAMVILLSMLAYVAVDHSESTRENAADAVIAKVQTALASYKNDMRALPMVDPTESPLVRNAKLVRALTDPDAGWPRAKRADFKDSLAKVRVDLDGDGEDEWADVLVDPWGRPYEWYSLKVIERTTYRVHSGEDT